MTTPESFLETERLVLRRLTPDDLDGLAALYADADVMRFYPSVRTREETARNLQWILEQYAAHPGTGLWGAVSKSDNRLVGRCGLIWQTVGERGENELEVGYMLHKAEWGHGYATEAARAIRDYAFRAFPDLPRVISLIRPENRSSERVAERNGMRPVRETLHANLRHRIWSIERDAWQSLVRA
jgi:RimJ/RimL family protein N-acetyltransferase